MHGNPVLIKLGFSPEDRVVILHADDLGLSHASNAAFADLLEHGLVLSGSVMVPCPWFPETACLGRAHPAADLGVHLTLNSEHATYRWRPLSTSEPASGLLDVQGYQPRTVKALHERMSAQAAVVEMRAQLDGALAAGIDVTHLDTHMAAVLHPELYSHYVGLALEYGIPALLPPLTPVLIQYLKPSPQLREVIRSQFIRLEGTGFPLFDHITSLSLQSPDDRVAQTKRAFDVLQPGLTHFILHPAAPGFDIEAIAGDARGRIADYEMLLSQELVSHLHAAGIHLIGYRQLRQAMRAEMGYAGGDAEPAG